ncbi:MAG: DUF4166 domain-containing protein [Rudaea sp.]
MSALFARVLGAPAFAALPSRVRALHAATVTRIYAGEADVERGTGLLARLCGWAAALPPVGRAVPLRVEIRARDGEETWTRRFDGHAMHSRLWAHGDSLCERLGFITFAFGVVLDASALVWRVRHVSALGVSLPPRWFAGVRANEFDDGSHYRFEVSARLPLVGLLVHYAGRLDVE